VRRARILPLAALGAGIALLACVASTPAGELPAGVETSAAPAAAIGDAPAVSPPVVVVGDAPAVPPPLIVVGDASAVPPPAVEDAPVTPRAPDAPRPPALAARGEAAARARSKPSAPGAATTTTGTDPSRPRVPAGVLARAASRRVQERGAAAEAAGADRAETAIEAIEIDWNAGNAAR
jgi:hypothetical protein